MKTTLITLPIAILVVLAAVASGHHFDAADFVAITFTTGLVAWTLAQYHAAPRTLSSTRCIHLPINAPIASVHRPAERCAA